MTIRECIINLINSPEKYLKTPKPEGLTISEIADAVGLSNEEKLVSRILNEIQKKNACIKSQAFRLGRIFLYKYYSTRKAPEVKADKLATKNKDTALEQNGDVLPTAIVARQLDLNEECFELIKLARPQLKETKEVIVREYFKALLKDKNKKRSITIDTINRYIYTLNLVYKSEVISMIDLKHHIKTDLERGCGWDIDNKTMKRITSLLKESNLITTFEFEVKYINNESEPSDLSEESEEYIEYYSDSGDDPTFKVKKTEGKTRKREQKSKLKSEAVVESKHSKVILAKPNVDPDDPRIQSNPAITNPSLRQDKELPNSILKRVIESKRKQEEGNKTGFIKRIIDKEMSESQVLRASHRLRKRGATIEDLIVKKQPTLEQKKIIQDNVEDSKITTRSLSAIKLSMKLEGLFAKKRKDHYQVFYTILAIGALDRNKVLKSVCEWYNLPYEKSNGITHNHMASLKRPRTSKKAPKNLLPDLPKKDEKFHLDQVSNLLQMDDYSSLQNIQDYDDILAPYSFMPPTPTPKITSYPSIANFFSDPLYTSITEYLTYQNRKKKSTKHQNLMLSLPAMLAPVKS